MGTQWGPKIWKRSPWGPRSPNGDPRGSSGSYACVPSTRLSEMFTPLVNIFHLYLFRQSMCIIPSWYSGKKLVIWPQCLLINVECRIVDINLTRFAIGGQVVAVIGVFALDSKPLFHVSPWRPFHTTFAPMFPSQGWGSREWVISFMVALVRIIILL